MWRLAGAAALALAAAAAAVFGGARVSGPDGRSRGADGGRR